MAGTGRIILLSFFPFFLVKATLPEGHFDVLHPGQPPPGGPDHEGGAAPHRHDPGPLLDAGRRDFGRQHSGTEVKIASPPKSTRHGDTDVEKVRREGESHASCRILDI